MCAYRQDSANVGTVTQFDVLVGGASSSIASVGPGTAGQVLQSGGNAANPAYSTATYPATAGTALNLLQSDGTNWVSTAPIVLRTANITVTNAQVKAMFVTPVQMIAAPGSGNIIVIDSFVLKLVYGGNNAFTGGGNLQLVDSGGELVANTMGAAVITGTANNYAVRTGSTSNVTLQTNYQNSAIFLNNATGAFTGNAANDNTLLVNIVYYILSM